MSMSHVSGSSSGDCWWAVFDKTKNKFLYVIIIQIGIESDGYGRDVIVISTVGKTNMGNSECSGYCCMTLKAP